MGSNMSATTHHIVLLGDSIFDNQSYVRSGTSVIGHMKNKIPTTWKATLCAVDGSVVSNIEGQLSRIPKDTTHLFISIGGNDALGFQSITSKPVSNVGEALLQLAGIRNKFKTSYSAMLDEVEKLGLPTAVCTVYNPNYGSDPQQAVASTGLTVLNDVIMESALKRGFPVIDLKTIFDSQEDYANPIEPSEKGGDKISNAIIRVLNAHNFASKQTVVYT